VRETFWLLIRERRRAALLPIPKQPIEKDCAAGLF